jgi:crotonobetainyl-CoA:carnitine CoA-transferase CaiB-like acyl-CoA transferase
VSGAGGPFAGTRVVDLAGLAGAYGTMLLAGLGADVIRVEPPGGDPMRAMPPLLDGVEPPENGLWFAYLSQGKRSVVLDRTTPEGAAQLERLVASADIVFDAEATYDLERHPRLVWVSITPFGRSGPRAHWKGSNLVAWAASGVLYTTGFVDRAPVVPGGPAQLACQLAALNATMGALLALRARHRYGAGQLVDISMTEACLALAPETGAPLTHDDRVHRPRSGNRRDLTRPFGLYPCADGFVSFLVLQPGHWKAMAQWILDVTGSDVFMDETFADIIVRREAAEFVDSFTEQVTMPSKKVDLFIEGQRRGIPITPVNTIADLLTDPHLRAAEFFEQASHPAIGAYTRPGPPFRVNHDWWSIGRAPLLGEHTDEVLASLP